MKFTYRIDRNSFVKISVIDIMGKEVSILENATKKAGTYEKRWFKSKGIATGYYNLVVEVDSKKISKRFLVE